MSSVTTHEQQPTSTISAPWTEEQVNALNYYQQSGVFHPFTSGTTGDLLIATTAGWVEVEGGPVVQNWAHAHMANRQAVEEIQAFMRGTLPPPQS